MAKLPEGRSALTDEQMIGLTHRLVDTCIDCKGKIEELEAKLAKAVEGLRSVIEACDQGSMIPRSGVGGMTIEANIKGSVYVGVPAWPIEEARTTLAALTGGKDE